MASSETVKTWKRGSIWTGHVIAAGLALSLVACGGGDGGSAPGGPPAGPPGVSSEARAVLVALRDEVIFGTGFVSEEGLGNTLALTVIGSSLGLAGAGDTTEACPSGGVVEITDGGNIVDMRFIDCRIDFAALGVPSPDGAASHRYDGEARVVVLPAVGYTQNLDVTASLETDALYAGGTRLLITSEMSFVTRSNSRPFDFIVDVRALSHQYRGDHPDGIDFDYAVVADDVLIAAEPDADFAIAYSGVFATLGTLPDGSSVSRTVGYRTEDRLRYRETDVPLFPYSGFVTAEGMGGPEVSVRFVEGGVFLAIDGAELGFFTVAEFLELMNEEATP